MDSQAGMKQMEVRMKEWRVRIERGTYQGVPISVLDQWIEIAETINREER